jgi:predicted enzyme related to lactoylglutathione lyase
MNAAAEFYRRVFDWTIEPVKGSGGDYHRVETSEVDGDGVPLSREAINGGLFRKGTHGIDVAFLEIEVGSIDGTLDKVLANGGKLIKEKLPMLDFAYFAIVQDPEGNYLGLMEYRK